MQTAAALVQEVLRVGTFHIWPVPNPALFVLDFYEKSVQRIAPDADSISYGGWKYLGLELELFWIYIFALYPTLHFMI